MPTLRRLDAELMPSRCRLCARFVGGFSLLFDRVRVALGRLPAEPLTPHLRSIALVSWLALLHRRRHYDPQCGDRRGISLAHATPLSILHIAPPPSHPRRWYDTHTASHMHQCAHRLQRQLAASNQCNSSDDDGLCMSLSPPPPPLSSAVPFVFSAALLLPVHHLLDGVAPRREPPRCCPALLLVAAVPHLCSALLHFRFVASLCFSSSSSFFFLPSASVAHVPPLVLSVCLSVRCVDQRNVQFRSSAPAHAHSLRALWSQELPHPEGLLRLVRLPAREDAALQLE